MSLLKKTVLLQLILVLLFGCSEETTVKPEAYKSPRDINFREEGFSISVVPYTNGSAKSTKIASLEKSSSNSTYEEFLMTVAKDDKKKEAIIVKENLDDGNNVNYNLYHYDTDDNLIATILIRDGKLNDIQIESERILVKSASTDPTFAAAKKQNCFEKGYSDYKEFYNQGDWREIACDLGDLFAGACTLGGVLAGAVNCL